MGIAEARRAALATLAALQAGGDPVEERRQARAARDEREQAPTVAERLTEWQLARVGDAGKPWSDRYGAEVRRVLAHDVLPVLGRRRLDETTRADWTGLVASKRKAAPASAAFLYRTISSFLNFAEAAGWVATPLLPRKGRSTLAPSGPSRERVLTDEELAAIWRASDREAPKLRAFVRLLVLTAAREGEVAELPAGEVDLAAATWTIQAARAKNGRALAVPLGPLALAELRAVWPTEPPAAGFRLLGRNGTAGFQGFSNLKQRLDAASGVSRWRWHDLRRTARTGMTKLGVPRDHAEAALNHISGRSGLERIYDRHDYAEEARGALMLWQAHVAGMVGAAGAVVSLGTSRRRQGQS